MYCRMPAITNIKVLFWTNCTRDEFNDSGVPDLIKSN